MIHELIMHSNCTGIDHSEELSENELMTLSGGQRKPKPKPPSPPPPRPEPIPIPIPVPVPDPCPPPTDRNQQ